MSDNVAVDIISDSPEVEIVEFGFEAYARTIAGLIANRNNKTPLVIGIYGPWGSGKTTLMKTVKRFLENSDYTNRDKFRKCKTVWFQAWKYDKEDEILAALVEEIFKAIKKDGTFGRIRGELEEFINKMDIPKGVGKLAKHFIGADVTDFISEPAYRAKLGFYDTFQEFFDRLLWTYTNLRPQFSSTEEPDDQKGALVVFIDDLDRCPRERIKKVLETIKLFMDKKGCIFVIGAANEIIEKALEDTYGREDACRFMEKIVQVIFKLPPIPPDDFKPLVEKINPQVKKNLFPYLGLIMPAMQNNPRQFKRFLNNLNLLDGLIKNSGVQIDFNHLLFWNIIDHIYPQLAKEIKEHHAVLYTLQKHTGSLAKEIGEGERWDIPQEKLKAIPPSFRGYVQNKELVDIVTQFTIDRGQLQRLLTFSGIVEGTEDKEEKMGAAKEYRTGLGDMVEIPAGVFQYGDDKKQVKIERPFRIDIYPVTNRQFEAFIQDKGYQSEDYWSNKGKEWRQENNITQPGYWDDEEWNQPEHPVVGVSYYEAEAYAKWAGKELPTDEQWERAARGTDGRTYPWGDEFDKEKCNTTDESGIGKTTRVTRYPNGISPDGCYDMAGNVWEWTTSSKGKLLMLRGGSWSSLHDDAR
ncbi:MAG: SUMF1/EgtB/PvdO family nonheme iron enzyme, partial [Proteobacteria bacterium]|nr:SUMF1/EgtB/PvdO family nonheme iron enzyme [Pseudomonadota bacterium]